jgi:lysyl endopeptidase
MNLRSRRSDTAITSLTLVTLGLFGFGGTAVAQVSFGGNPPSQTNSSLAPVPTLEMAAVDVDALLDEDRVAPKDQPFRFGAELPVDVDLRESGALDVLDGGAKLFRLRIASTDAISINLVFSRFVLPDGAELYVYNDGYEDILGSFNAMNNKENGEFAIAPIPGEAITLEYFEPAWVDAPGEIRIGTVVHAYRDIVSLAKSGIPLKAAGACNVDVNCPAGAGWELTRRATALIILGGGLCTGSLLNNSANNGDRLFMSANHCGNITNAVFRFNYEKANCGSGTAPTNQTVQGSTLLAAGATGDYRLVRIVEAIPASYNVYYPGWDRSTSNPTSAVTIHHPDSDVKKISFENNPLTKSQSFWRVAQWDLGVTEPGSSGCPLYTANKKFIGQLYGGEAFCGFPFNDYYGRLELYWNAVKAHLDPLNTGAVTIADYDPNANCGNVAPYGTGCPGTFGLTPNLAMSGCFSANGAVNLTISIAVPGQSAFLFIGLNAASIPLGGGCNLLTSPILTTVGPFPLNGIGPGTGSFSINTNLPPTLTPGTIRMQAVCTDPGATLGYTVTRGLAVTFQ